MMFINGINDLRMQLIFIMIYHDLSTTHSIYISHLKPLSRASVRDVPMVSKLTRTGMISQVTISLGFSTSFRVQGSKHHEKNLLAAEFNFLHPMYTIVYINVYHIILYIYVFVCVCVCNKRLTHEPLFYINPAGWVSNTGDDQPNGDIK